MLATHKSLSGAFFYFMHLSLDGLRMQSYLYVTCDLKSEKDMNNHEDMTDSAQAVLHFLPAKWTSTEKVSDMTGITRPRCQLILTQLAMAGLVEDLSGGGEKFRRCG
ncbi:hypothetical protein [Pantoea ananatis]|uniref:hypothetical protein n=1 Tax=Pantoea ananas TaxID=553 RepID=UPI003FA48DC1